MPQDKGGSFVSGLFGTKRRDSPRDARVLLREAHRLLRRYADRLAAPALIKVRADIAALEEVTPARDPDKLAAALDALDATLDANFAFGRKSSTREWFESIGVAVLIALLLRAFVVEAFKIPSGSMIPTLAVGDHIFVNKFIYGVRIPWTLTKFGMGYRPPKRGEVIVFIAPKAADANEPDFIKRVVAVAGDTVEIRDDQLIVNGTPVPRKHIDGDCRYFDFVESAGQWQQFGCERWEESVEGSTYTTYYDKHGSPHSFPPRTVPPGNVFVMGDNRDHSNDSRYWGFVPYPRVTGKAMVIWWSLGEPEGVRVGRLFHLVH